MWFIWRGACALCCSRISVCSPDFWHEPFASNAASCSGTGKEGFPTIAYQVIGTHDGQAIEVLLGAFGSHNDKTIVKFDPFVTDVSSLLPWHTRHARHSHHPEHPPAHIAHSSMPPTHINVAQLLPNSPSYGSRCGAIRSSRTLNSTFTVDLRDNENVSRASISSRTVGITSGEPCSAWKNLGRRTATASGEGSWNVFVRIVSVCLGA